MINLGWRAIGAWGGTYQSDSSDDLSVRLGLELEEEATEWCRRQLDIKDWAIVLDDDSRQFFIFRNQEEAAEFKLRFG